MEIKCNAIYSHCLSMAGPTDDVLARPSDCLAIILTPHDLWSRARAATGSFALPFLIGLCDHHTTPLPIPNTTPLFV